LPEEKSYGVDFSASVSLQAVLDIYRLATRYGMTELAERASGDLNRFYGELPSR